MKLRYIFLVMGMSAMVCAGTPAKKKPIAAQIEKPTPKPPEKVVQGDEWEIAKDGGFLAYTVDFHITKDDKDNGKVQRKGLFTPRYSYTLYDNQGELVAHSLTQFLSSGFLFHSLTDIDVWDANNQYIGTISGKFWTNSRAKFDFFNSKGAHFGAAHLNTETTNFIIAANTGKGMKPIGGLEAEGYGDMSAITVKLKRNFQDDRMLKIFAAFISDYHDYFVVKPEINNYNIDFGSSRD